MKKLLRKIVSCMLVFSILMGSVSLDVYAITQDDVSSRLSSLMSQYVGTTWNQSFAGGTQCYAFAHYIFNNIFGRGSVQVGNGAVSSNSTCYKLNNVANDVTVVGILEPGYTVSDLTALFNKIRPGDYVQVKRRSSGGPHSMIAVNADSTGINIFDANSDGKGTIKNYTQSPSTFYDKNSGVSVYRHNSYDTQVCYCSESYAGDYTVTTSSASLNMRSGHGSSYGIVTTIPKGAKVYVSKGDGTWAHVEYNGYSGYCSMEYLTKVSLDLKLKCWFSNTGMGDAISEVRTGSDLYLCYKIYDANTGKLWNELENKNYSVKQTIYNPDGSEHFSYTYQNSDNNWIRINPEQTGTYTGKIEISGDQNGVLTRTITVKDKRSFGIKTWFSDTKMGDTAESVEVGDGIYLCYKIYNQDSGILFNDLDEYDVSYTVKEVIYDPSGKECKSATFTQSDNNYIVVTAEKSGIYKGVITLNLGGQIHSFTKEVTVNQTTDKVSYNANGGTGEPGTQTKTKGTTLQLSSVKPQKAYTLTYDKNGGTLATTSKIVNCTFNSWNTKQDGSGTKYSSGGNYTVDSNVTLYAQWTNPIAGTLNTPTREGYTFNGWYSGGKQITPSTTITGNMTLVANWTKNVQSTGILAAGSVQGKAKDTVAVPIILEKNPGIIAIQCKLKYDSSKVKLVNVESADIMDGSALSTNYSQNPYILSFGDGLDETDITTIGNLAVVYFEILPAFTEGTTKLELIFENAYDKDLNEVDFETKSGEIEIKSYIPGDVNGDGQVKLNDAMLLRRYVAGWDVTIDMLAGDVNRDGQVKLNDAMLLRRYVAGWDVVLK